MSWLTTRFKDEDPPRKRAKVKNDVFLPVDEETPLLSWRPKKKDDLVVHKKKLEEVDSWLFSLKRKQGSSILCLTGPPGCGKLTSLRVLSTSAKINVLEWNPQVEAQPYEEGAQYVSATNRFLDFVTRATRYPNVLTLQTSRLIVVKDVPNGFIRDPSSFVKFLEEFMSVPDVYLAFIMTDQTIIRSLFTDSVKRSFNVTTIAFNPITVKGIQTTLNKVTRGDCPELVANVSLSCNGDLRNALTTLQFLSVGKPPPQNDKNDQSIDLFRGLGRVLYAKRSHGALVHSPVSVAEAFTSSPDLFLGMLHCNYLNTFSSIYDVAKAAKKLSLAEVLLRDFDSDSTTIGLVLSSFGLMVSNKEPIRKFQHFSKPWKAESVLVGRTDEGKSARELIDVCFYAKHLGSRAQSYSQLLSKFTSFPV